MLENQSGLRLAFPQGMDGSRGIQIQAGPSSYHSPRPVSLMLKRGSSPETLSSGYQEVSAGKDGYFCRAEVSTPAGSRFLFEDSYRLDGQDVLFQRSVSVVSAGAGDEGFSTEFRLLLDSPRKLPDYDVFAPGIWYRKNENVVPTAFAADYSNQDFCFRATRMALPYVELYDPESRAAVSLCHLSPVPTNGTLDRSTSWMVDESFQFSSVGVSRRDGLALCCLFPGSEGERNYIINGSAWVRRSHPVSRDVRHSYGFCLHFSEEADAYAALRDHWRHYEKYYPRRVNKCDPKAVYEAGIELLDAYTKEYAPGAMGLPFWTEIPSGEICDITYQMGFVGQQTQCGYHLIKYGTERGVPEITEKGKKIIDFWVRESKVDGVLPRVWYETDPPGFKKDYPVYTRTIADGMEGVLNAYQYLRRQGTDKQDWKAFCVDYGDWLAEHQNSDGSFYRAYEPDGSAAHDGKFNTTNLIRFLVNLYWLTGDEKLSACAVRAGEFCLGAISDPMQYVGGTADNDNTIDKEAGMIALYAFLALYDLTGEKIWVQAAQRAADFCETWTYQWSFPIAPKEGCCVFRGGRDITGLSLIATGHSHADVMMDYCVYDYYRLWLLTGDRHYYDYALFLLHNAKQTTDWDGTLGYRYRGLVEESGEVALQFHNGLGRWLPWCTIAEIEPLTRLEEHFGAMDLEAVREEDAPRRITGSSFMKLN